MRCEYCNKSLSWADYHCPHCDHKNHGLFRVYIVLGLVVLIMLFIAGLIWQAVK